MFFVVVAVIYVFYISLLGAKGSAASCRRESREGIISQQQRNCDERESSVFIVCLSVSLNELMNVYIRNNDDDDDAETFPSCRLKKKYKVVWSRKESCRLKENSKKLNEGVIIYLVIRSSKSSVATS